MRHLIISRAIVLGAFSLSGLLGCGTDSAAANSGTGAPNTGSARGGPGGGSGQPSPVEVSVVERVRIARTSLVTGQLSPLRVVGVTSQVAGALVNVPVEEGSRVSAGQLLAELDSRELRAQLDAAEKNLVFVKSNADRSAALLQEQVVTRFEFERDQAALGAAEATVSQLRTRLGFTRIVSPIDGVVTQRFVQTGDVVGGQSRMFTVADISTLVTQLPVSELEVPMLRVGSTVSVQVDAIQRSVPGRIRRIFPAADSVSRLVPVEIAIDGPAARELRPGYSVRVTLQLDERDNALVVPTRAVVGAAGSQSVFVVSEGRAERRRVRVGPDTDGRMEVFEGLVAGDTIITTGNSLLRDGATVRIVQPLSPDMAGTSTRALPEAAPSSGPPAAVPGARP
jgi:membrane fusion protein (multidrug efflux system)